MFGPLIRTDGARGAAHLLAAATLASLTAYAVGPDYIRPAPPQMQAGLDKAF